MGWFRGHFWVSLLCHFRWYRRWHGGVWELWLLDAPAVSMWYVLEEPTRGGARPSPSCRGTPTVEDYREAPVCPKCGSTDLYVEVTCPRASIRFRGDYLKGGILCCCNVCHHSWGSQWPKEKDSCHKPIS